MIPLARRPTPPGIEAEFGQAVNSVLPGFGGSADPQSAAFSLGPPASPDAANPPGPPGDLANSSLLQPELRVPPVVVPAIPPLAAADVPPAAISSGAAVATSDGAGILRPNAASAAATAAAAATSTPAATAVAGPAAGEPAPLATISVAGVSGRPGGLEGRDPQARGKLLAHFGGSLTSEAAVADGLRWLVLHQQADGSWHFNHQNDACHGYCGNPGNFASTTAATGLALLPFLGAGHTHLAGEHSETVRRGIYYLAQRITVTDKGGDLQEGTMYGQGLATIALCEAYALSHDEALRPYAQSALDFIIQAQDPVGGGWRYAPLSPGDTTVTGWQFMALKSGLLAGLQVPPATLERTSHFLDGVETDYGAGYGYQKPGKGPTTSAVGILGRMLTGWRRDRPALASGVRRLDRLGPSPTDMYYNYYATQVLRHYGGASWDRWNKVLRERLIASQARQGHPRGSWYLDDPHGEVGGRLYITCMAIMTLEVYYRYMPLYGKQAIGE